MDIKKDKLYITFTPKPTRSFNTLFLTFNKLAKDYLKNNIILDFTNFVVTEEELLQFEKFSKKKLGLGTSFVVIRLGVDLDKIPDELIIVPTFQEAIDIIEMDEMTRSLDF